MGSAIEVSMQGLMRAEQLWREQSQGAAQAAKAVENAGTTGFDPDVKADVVSFLDTWSSVAKTVSANVDDVATSLEGFRRQFDAFETHASGAFTALGSDFVVGQS